MMGGITERGAIMACGGMAVMYVGILYSPTLIFRRPPPTSFYNYMIRRFICAFFSSLLALLLSYLLLTSPLPTGSWTLTSLLSAYGVRSNHFLLALVSSFSLTCLIYAGNFVLNSLLLFDLWSGSPSFSFASLSRNIFSIIISLASDIGALALDIGAWRNLIVAPITEELVFRACMIPLLLCGGFKPLNIVFFCPLFFSLAHLNHLLEFYRRKNFSVLKTSLAVGTQLAYTLVFGSYASFLFIRTGHLVAPLVAHVVCNSIGLPVVYSKRGLVVSLAFIGGAIGFLWLLIPLTDPALYNFKNDDCRCWQGYSTLSCNR